MYHCNDQVVYANYGVCDVAETETPMSYGPEDRLYYVLVPRRERGGKVYVPMDKEDLMRPVMSREEAVDLVKSIGSIAPDPFRDNNSRTVEDHFKTKLRGSDCRTAIEVVITMRQRIAEQERKKHLPSSMYTRILDQAQRQVASELCAALGIEEPQLQSYIDTHKR